MVFFLHFFSEIMSQSWNMLIIIIIYIYFIYIYFFYYYFFYSYFFFTLFLRNTVTFLEYVKSLLLLLLFYLFSFIFYYILCLRNFGHIFVYVYRVYGHHRERYLSEHLIQLFLLRKKGHFPNRSLAAPLTDQNINYHKMLVLWSCWF